MNIKAIIASLVLGSSSIAMASPSVTVSATAGASTQVVRDHRFDDSYRAPAPIVQPIAAPAYSGWRRPAPVYRPVTLASGMSFAADGRTSVTVGAQAGRFNTLQISGAAGKTLINAVYVQFDHGQEQVVRNLNRVLVGNQSFMLDLDGNFRAIRRVIVYGNGLTTGWYRSAGTFNVTAA